jgi:acetyl-CoA carboxylase biotin carboxyl carrier protein
MDIKDLSQIINILKQNDVTEFELTQDGVTIKLSRGAQQLVMTTPVAQTRVEPAIGSAPMHSQPMSNGNGHHSSPAQPASDPSLLKVESPIVGTFYRKPSPDKAVFVKEGDYVKKGDTLCIVEAMKLMNEIESPYAGRVEKVLGTEGQVVEFGEVLFLINPS